MKEVTAELGMTVPDYLTNKDVYKALDSAATVLEQAHIETHDMHVVGLDFPENTDGNPDDFQQGEAA